MAGYEVRRATTIQAPPEAVYDRIANLTGWTSWSPWEGRDPDLTRTYSGPESGVGASYAWQGNREVGAGSMTITQADRPGTVALDLRFLKPFKSQSVTTFLLEPADGGTRVTWVMTGSYTALSRVFSVFMPMDKMVGGDFEKGLAQLKAELEA